VLPGGFASLDFLGITVLISLTLIDHRLYTRGKSPVRRNTVNAKMLEALLPRSLTYRNR
jgi:hypothetical protein